MATRTRSSKIHSARVKGLAVGEKDLIDALLSKERDLRREALALIDRTISESALEVVVELLADSDALVRQDAIRILQHFPIKRISIPVRRYLMHPEWSTREAAVQLLSHFAHRDDEVSRLLRHCLYDPVPGVSLSAARAIAPPAHTSLAEQLVTMLADPHAHVRYAAALALQRCELSKIVLRISELTYPPQTSEIREVALLSLCGTPLSEGVTALCDSASDPTALIRARAIEALCGCKDGRALQALLTALDDESPGIRARAARAVSPTHATGSAKLITLALKDDFAFVREAAVVSLGTHCKGAIEHALTQIVAHESNEAVRTAAVTALSKATSTAAHNALIAAALSDRHHTVQRAAIATLHHHSSPQIAAILAEIMLHSTDQVLREEAVLALHGMLPEWERELLRRTLTREYFLESNETVRCHCVKLLAQGCTAADLKALETTLLHDPSPRVRIEVATHLAGTLTRIGEKALRLALQDEQAVVRRAAIKALPSPLPPDSSNVVVTLLRHDPDTTVRRYCAEKLAAPRTKEEIAALVHALKDNDPLVRATTRFVIAKTKNAKALLERCVAALDTATTEGCAVLHELTQLLAQDSATTLKIHAESATAQKRSTSPNV